MQPIKDNNLPTMASLSSSPVDEMIKSGRCYYNPSQFQIIGVHTTEALMTQQDTAHSYRKHFDAMIEDSLNYHGDLRDNQVFDTMNMLLPNGKRNKVFLNLGLYLHLADEVSRTEQPMTFLHAGRKIFNHLELEKINNDRLVTFDPNKNRIEENDADYQARLIKNNDLRKEWFHATLDELNLKSPEHKKLIEDWTTKGHFYVGSELQAQENGRSVGSYPQLAEIVCDPKQYFSQISHCIAKALGSKENIIGKTPEEVLDYTRETVKAVNNIENLRFKKLEKDDLKVNGNIPYSYDSTSSTEFINSMSKSIRLVKELQDDIHTGYDIRRDRLAATVRQKLATTESLTRLNKEGETFFRNVFSNFSPEVTEALNHTGHRFAYTDSASIRSIYPSSNTYGLSAKNSEDARDAVANYIPRFKIIMMSNGLKTEVGRASTEKREQDPLEQAQTLRHESLHIILGTVTKDSPLLNKKIQLFEAINNLFDPQNPQRLTSEAARSLGEIKSETMQGNPNLKNILDVNSQSYSNYPPIDKDAPYKRAEEVAANIYGFIGTEFKKERTGNNPFHEREGGMHIEAYKPLREITKMVDDLMKEASLAITEKIKRTREAEKASIRN